MSDQESQRGLLWRFQRTTGGQPARGAADVDPATAIYRLFANTHNPFVQRAIAPRPERADRSEGELADLSRMLSSQRLYHVGPSNENKPFRRRQLAHPKPPPVRAPRYLEPDRLSGRPGRLPLLVDEFFQDVLARLRADPESFYTVVNDLTALFRANHIRIKIYEAYHGLQDWDDLMATLTEIAHYPSLETFDLFCSALLAYYDLVYPPQPVR
jgi:hypothetical protein